MKNRGTLFPDFSNFVIMRKLVILLILIICGCGDEFYPFNPDADPIPIVFGLIDTKDSIHTVRLTKTFTGSKDAYILAKDTLSFLYDSVRMIIECLDVNLKVLDSLTFHKTYFKTPSSGIFNSGKSWYYLSTDKFPVDNAFVRFRLKAWIHDDNTTIISGSIYNYLPRDRTEIFSPTADTKYLSVYNVKPATIEFSSYERCGVRIRFNYSEVTKDGTILKSVETFWYNTLGIIYLTPEKLFMFVKNNVPENPDADFRIFNSLDIFSYSAPDRLLIYNRLFNGDKSLFSNINFFETPDNNIINGNGLFCRYSKDSIIGLKFDRTTLDSLATGQLTKGLRFISYQ
jgi:hypothetical protein